MLSAVHALAQEVYDKDFKAMEIGLGNLKMYL